MIRSFCAIQLPPDVRDRLNAGILKLCKTPVHAAWGRAGQMHVTLTFHGDQPDERIKDLIDILPQAIASLPAFDVRIHGVGFFGRPRAPRVIWAGVTEGHDALVALRQAVATAAQAAGIAIEARPYHPHITLGRIRRAVPDSRRELILAMQAMESTDFGVVPVRQVAVMQSRLTADGACHGLLAAVAIDRPDGT